MIGIYRIVNVVTNKVYVGSSINIARRWRVHKSKLSLGKHPSKHLQASWTKYGKNYFKFFILELVSEDILDNREQYWANRFRAFIPDYGYNQRKIVESNKGFHHSDSTKLRIGKSSRGRKLSKGTKEKIRIALLGKKLSQAHIHKMRTTKLAQKIKQSPELVERRMQKISKAKVHVSCGMCTTIVYKLPGQAKRTKFCSRKCQLESVHQLTRKRAEENR